MRCYRFLFSQQLQHPCCQFQRTAVCLLLKLRTSMGHQTRLHSCSVIRLSASLNQGNDSTPIRLGLSRVSLFRCGGA